MKSLHVSNGQLHGFMLIPSGAIQSQYLLWVSIGPIVFRDIYVRVLGGSIPSNHNIGV